MPLLYEFTKTKGHLHISGKERKKRRFYIAGWLVATEGREKGKDFQIYAGKNKINREICIIYDPKGNRFYLAPEAGEIVCLNGELQMDAAEIRTGDQISCGENEYEFVAFCRGNRVWK